MNTVMIKTTYLEHSGFLVETSECALIFDYYRGEIPLLPEDTPLYILASHKHRDHFNPEIFALQERYSHITYILSHDIQDIPNKTTGLHYMITPDESINFPHFTLKTTGSTDQGVSFLLTLHNGETIFHAGDLNWWTWMTEDTDEQAHAMEVRFKKEVAKLEPYQIDLAFLPLDPRQQERFFWGFDYYMKKLDITLAFPMHFWGDDNVIDRLKSLYHSHRYRHRIGALRKNGDYFIS